MLRRGGLRPAVAAADPHRVAERHVLAGQDVRLAEPAAVERRDDPAGDVVDVGRRDAGAPPKPMNGAVPS